jgi:hypothetical protein
MLILLASFFVEFSKKRRPFGQLVSASGHEEENCQAVVIRVKLKKWSIEKFVEIK